MDGIHRLDPSDFKKCSEIWDMKKQKELAKQFYGEIVGGVRETFVLERRGKFIGEISVVYENGDADYTVPLKRVYFSRLIVKKELRRQGIGKKLCEYLIKYVTEKGYNEMSIGVDIDNFPAICLYQKMGFDKIIFVGEDGGGKYFKLLKTI